jgi:hypothetical protein
MPISLATSASTVAPTAMLQQRSQGKKLQPPALRFSMTVYSRTHCWHRSMVPTLFSKALVTSMLYAGAMYIVDLLYGLLSPAFPSSHRACLGYGVRHIRCKGKRGHRHKVNILYISFLHWTSCVLASGSCAFFWVKREAFWM